jgi:hypothetical protein
MPDPSNTSLSSHSGASFTFNGLSSRITKIEGSNSVTPKETSHLGQSTGSRPIFKKSPLVDGPEIKVDFYGNAKPTRGTKATVTIPANMSPTGSDLATKAICTGCSIKATRGKFVTGSATFKLSGG